MSDKEKEKVKEVLEKLSASISKDIEDLEEVSN